MKKHGVASQLFSSFDLKSSISLHKPFYPLCRDYVFIKQNLKNLVISKIKNKKNYFFLRFLLWKVSEKIKKVFCVFKNEKTWCCFT